MNREIDHAHGLMAKGYTALMKSGEQKRGVDVVPDSWRGTGMILVADDDAFILRLSSKMLVLLGFTPLVVNDGIEALDAVRKYKDDIVCAILDLSMAN